MAVSSFRAEKNQRVSRAMMDCLLPTFATPSVYRMNLPELAQPWRLWSCVLCALMVWMVGGATVAAAAEPGQAEPMPFDIGEYRVLGNTRLDARSIESAVYPYLGPHRNFTDVESARAALETVYRDHGFGTVFVDIPEQSVDDGIVRLRVTEGKLHASSITGARFFSERQIRAQVPAAAAGQVPNLQELRKEISLVNAQSPDRQVVPVLKAGPEPGTVDLALHVDDHLPLHGSVELNNQYTVGTSALRLLGSVSYGNVFGRLDTLSLQYQTAPEDRSNAKVVAASYTAHVGEGRSLLTFSYIDSDSAVAAIGTLGVLGTGRTYSVLFTEPLRSSAAVSDAFVMGVDYKQSVQNVLDAGPGINTPISYLNTSVGYTGNAAANGRQWTWSSMLNFGIRSHLNKDDAFADKCFECEPNYLYLRLDGSVRQQLPGGLALYVHTAAQGAEEPVISNEQFLIGGATSVRGYLVAEELGDSGASGTLELQGPNVFSFSKRTAHFQFVPAIFFDAGLVRLLEPLSGQARFEDLRSVGAGFDFAIFNAISGSLYWGDPLISTSHTRANDGRWQFSVRGVW